MKIQQQLIKHDPAAGQYGDCQRTCIAVILGIDAADVPHFCDNPQAERGTSEWWSTRQDAWLAERGLAYCTVAYDGAGVSLEQVLDWTSRQNATTPMILCGLSALGCNHVVVVLGGKIVCDPSGNGIVGPTSDGLWEVSMITLGPAWRAAA